MLKVTAHRGYSGLYPENTMLAFQKAEEAGADEIELDAQLSRDGEIVVCHDEFLERLTGQRSFVRDLKLTELQKLDTSGITHGGKFGFNTIPSLDEYFAWVKKTGITTNIELKNGNFYYEGLEEKTIELIAKHGLEEKVYFSSFNHVSLVKCKKINPAIPCGVLVPMAAGNAGHYVRSNGLDFYHPNMEKFSGEAAENCKENGVGVNVWTIDTMAGLVRAREWECRAVITDFPDVCKAWIKSGK